MAPVAGDRPQFPAWRSHRVAACGALGLWGGCSGGFGQCGGTAVSHKHGQGLQACVHRVPYGQAGVFRSGSGGLGRLPGITLG